MIAVQQVYLVCCPLCDTWGVVLEEVQAGETIACSGCHELVTVNATVGKGKDNPLAPHQTVELHPGQSLQQLLSSLQTDCWWDTETSCRTNYRIIQPGTKSSKI